LQRAKFVIAYARKHGPITVRGLYYQAEVAGVPGITKADGDYNKIQQQVLKLRRSGELPYRHIADATRWMRKPSTFNGVEDLLWNAAQTYRKMLWADTEDYIEIWCEKDALAGVIYPVTSLFDVPLMITRGFSSETFAFEAVEQRGNDPRDFHVYYLGDFDRAGQDASNALFEKLQRFAKGKPFTVYMYDLAVTEQQIRDWDLPTREPKRKSEADKRWPHEFACELDAIPPDTLRDLVQSQIEQYLPKHQLDILKKAEESERKMLRMFANRFDDFKAELDENGS
jgi:hypothetical protein